MAAQFSRTSQWSAPSKGRNSLLTARRLVPAGSVFSGFLGPEFESSHSLIGQLDEWGRCDTDCKKCIRKQTLLVLLKRKPKRLTCSPLCSLDKHPMEWLHLKDDRRCTSMWPPTYRCRPYKVVLSQGLGINRESIERPQCKTCPTCEFWPCASGCRIR